MPSEEVRTVEALLRRMVAINTVHPAVSGVAKAEAPLALAIGERG